MLVLMCCCKIVEVVEGGRVLVLRGSFLLRVFFLGGILGGGGCDGLRGLRG